MLEQMDGDNEKNMSRHACRVQKQSMPLGSTQRRKRKWIKC